MFFLNLINWYPNKKNAVFVCERQHLTRRNQEIKVMSKENGARDCQAPQILWSKIKFLEAKFIKIFWNQTPAAIFFPNEFILSFSLFLHFIIQFWKGGRERERERERLYRKSSANCVWCYVASSGTRTPSPSPWIAHFRPPWPIPISHLFGISFLPVTVPDSPDSNCRHGGRSGGGLSWLARRSSRSLYLSILARNFRSLTLILYLFHPIYRYFVVFLAGELEVIVLGLVRGN